MLRQLALPKQLAIALALVLAAGAMWFVAQAAGGLLDEGGGDKSRKSGGARPVPVIVAPVAFARDDLVLEAVGTGRAIRSVTLRAEASGMVSDMPLTAGTRFAAGDVLLRIEDKDEQLARSMAATRVADARRTLGRLEQLRGRGATSVSTLDDARTAHDIARLELQRAEKALEDHLVRAPFAGVAGIPDIEAGAWIDTANAIASYDDRSTILVEFDLPEAFLGRAKVGMAVSATTPAVPDREFQGEVVALDSRITATSRTVKVRVALPNADDTLRPGASFVVKLALPGGQFPAVPELAVQFARGSLHVWRIKDDKAERVEVRMVRRREGAVLIDGPLQPNDVVIIEGTQRLSDGRAVRVLKAEPEGTS